MSCLTVEGRGDLLSRTGEKWGVADKGAPKVVILGQQDMLTADTNFDHSLV